MPFLELKNHKSSINIMPFIIRKIKRCGFTTINNSLLRNPELTANERVALILALSLPDTKADGTPFDYSCRGFTKIMGVSFVTVQKTFKSLEEKGYIYRFQEREDGYYNRMVYVFYEDSGDNPYYHKNDVSNTVSSSCDNEYDHSTFDKPYMKGFTNLDNKTVRNTDLTPVQRLIWWQGLSLPQFKNNGDPFEVSIISLTKALSLTQDTVQRSLCILVEKGYLKREHYINSDNKHKNRYIFIEFPELNQEDVKDEECINNPKDEEAQQNQASSPRYRNPNSEENQSSCNEDCYMNPKHEIYTSEKHISDTYITKEIIDKEQIIKEKNNTANILNSAVISKPEDRKINNESFSIKTVRHKIEKEFLPGVMADYICKVFDKNITELNGIEKEMINEWIRCGADIDMLTLAVNDNLYKRSFSIGDIDKTLTNWIRNGATNKEDCQKMIDEAHKKNLEAFKERNHSEILYMSPGKAEAIREIESGDPYSGLMMLLSNNEASGYLSPAEIDIYVIPYLKKDWEGKWIAEMLIKKLEA